MNACINEKIHVQYIMQRSPENLMCTCAVLQSYCLFKVGRISFLAFLLKTHFTATHVLLVLLVKVVVLRASGMSFFHPITYLCTLKGKFTLK